MARMPEGYVTTRVIGNMKPGDRGLIDLYDLDVDEHGDVWIPYYETYETGDPSYRDQAWVEMTEEGPVVTIRSEPSDPITARPLHHEVARQGVVKVAQVLVDVDTTFEEDF